MSLPDSVWASEPEPATPAASLPPGPAAPRIKVLHVITKFTTGAGGNTLHSATGMDPARYEVWVAARPGGECFEPARRAGIRTVEIPRLAETIRPLDDWLAYRALVRLIKRERFSIVHTHTAKAGLIGRMAARRCHVPVVIHTFHAFPFHDHMSRLRRRVYLAIDRTARRSTHAFLAVAPQVARDAVENRLAPPGTVRVAPSSVELADIPRGRDRAFRDEIGIGEDVPLIGTVGRITFQKAPKDFVRAAAAVAAVRPDARFVMVGDGPMEAEARAEAARLGIDLLFTGFRDDAHRIAAAFDVFVMPSLYEGLGRALTEALASGRPVVASAVNGVADLVRPGATGLLSRPGDPAHVAECILWMLEHPSEARRMGIHGRNVVRSLFSQQRMCEILDRTYRSLLGMPTEELRARPVRLSDAHGNGARPAQRVIAT
ncbi:MAG TPA: glycosyltransferase family 4 protein [Actinomycetota bacterium]|nr:glycosyltransferase family 4 protein [Actinomycetota bacterium]